ncbi:MAG: hypothetical protein IPF60_12965 [Betaproteobacteria bacterium]|nr:hypothetical protein [Betaproteobacteria bacterium]
MPFRFYVEVPTLPLDLNPARPQRHAGWWLLAFLSGQLDPDVAGLLPDDSAWRRVLVPVDEGTEAQVPLRHSRRPGRWLAADALVAWLTRPPGWRGARPAVFAACPAGLGCAPARGAAGWSPAASVA